MSEFAIFDITDGTRAGTVSLLSPTLGFHLNDWTPALAEPKGGGVWQNSPLADLRRNVQSVLATSNEVFDLKINGTDQDALIVIIQDFLRLLLQGRDYWITDWQNTIVYLRARAKCETNIRYAELRGFTIAELDNPYAQPFYSSTIIAGLDNITLGIERGHWLADVPGESTCVLASAQQDWGLLRVWESNTTLPPGAIHSLLQTANDDIYAGEVGDIFRSQDDGTSWANNTTLPSSDVTSMIQTTAGTILASSTDEVLRSANNGASWASIAVAAGATLLHSLVQVPNGDILVADGGGDIWRSQDDGLSYVKIHDGAVSEIVRSMYLLSNGTLIIGRQDRRLQTSIDNGVTLSTIATTSIVIESFLEISAINPPLETPSDESRSKAGTGDKIIFAGGASDVIRSSDGGLSWASTSVVPTDAVRAMIQAINEDLYAFDIDGEIWRSTDRGASWFADNPFVTAIGESLLQTRLGDLYAGDDSRILKKPNTPFLLGRAATCTNETYITNTHHLNNLSNVKVFDANLASYTDIFPNPTFPVDMLPAVPAVGDITYFGVQATITGLDSGPFSNIVFDIGTPGISSTSHTIVWEYYNGAWVALTVEDNTANSDAFDKVGVNSVHWEQPSDWTTVVIDGVTAYWVRARLSALTGTLTTPTQQNRNFYSIVQPYTDIAATAVLGDLPAMARTILLNQSDGDGRGGSAPNLWENRIIAGLRSVSRGSGFTAYLNASDEQNPAEVTVSLGTNTTFATDVTTPTGRRAIYNPAGVEAIADRVTWQLSAGIARDFYGTFHAFARVRRVAGLVTDFTIRLRIATGTGGIAIDTQPVQIQTSTAFELLDFGQIEVPASDILQPTELGDRTDLIIRASAASGTPDLYVYDLILIPVDEWAGDFTDGRNNTSSDIDHSGSNPLLLDIDSLTFPKRSIRSLVREFGTDLIVSIYRAEANGPAILQANTQQRLWFLAAQTSATGTSFDWIAPHEIAHSLQLYHNARYLGFRGNR